jgi:N-acetyl-anhydromuramyl-L-alanine amidase AmpD
MRRIDTIVLHWTGGEGDVRQVQRVLRERGCSVHYFVDREGTRWTMMPDDIVAFHASGVNDHSLGIEIANYGMRADPSQIPARGRNRTIRPMRWDGRDVRVADFYPVQIDSVIALVRELLGRHKSIPRTVCVSESKQKPIPTGVIGHCHCSAVGKLDPGLFLLREVAAALRRPDRPDTSSSGDAAAGSTP